MGSRQAHQASWERCRLGWAAETLLMPGARSKRCREIRPLTGWVDSARARATGDGYAHQCRTPVALGALALTHPSQGRHRPRPLAHDNVGVKGLTGTNHLYT